MNTWPDTSRPPPFVYKNRLAIPSESSLPGVRIQYGAPGSLRLDVRRSGNKNKALKLKVLAAHSTGKPPSFFPFALSTPHSPPFTRL